MYSRIVAVRAIILGRPTANAASLIDMDRCTVQMGMERYREQGIDGLRDTPRAGCKPKATQ